MAFYEGGFEGDRPVLASVWLRIGAGMRICIVVCVDFAIAGGLRGVACVWRSDARLLGCSGGSVCDSQDFRACVHTGHEDDVVCLSGLVDIFEA